MRIVVLTYESFYSNLMTERLVSAYPGQVVGILRSDALIYGKSYLQGVWYLRRRSGLRFVGRKALELLQSRATAIIFRLIRRPPKVRSLREMRRHFGVPTVGTQDVNDDRSLALLHRWRPDLVISIYLNQLIKGAVIGLPSQGVINIHPALLPRYRGLFPYFWVIANGETETGVTIHWVDESFDTGDILMQEKIAIRPQDTITSLAAKSAVAGAEMLVEAVRLIEEGCPPSLPQDHSQASYYSWPRPEDQRRFRRRGGSYGTIFELWKHM